jgi:two-component system alkaline phosphatase synthesis response regulator PhoP
MPQRILICDDEPHILHAVSFKLSAGGFDVIQAHNGREAIEWVESHNPDFVITDYQMPEIDGFEFCRYLRNRPETADVPIVMLTAKALELSEQEVKEQWKLEAVLMKPFSPRGLLDLVKKALSRRAVGAAMVC